MLRSINFWIFEPLHMSSKLPMQKGAWRRKARSILLLSERQSCCNRARFAELCDPSAVGLRKNVLSLKLVVVSSDVVDVGEDDDDSITEKTRGNLSGEQSTRS